MSIGAVTRSTAFALLVFVAACGGSGPAESPRSSLPQPDLDPPAAVATGSPPESTPPRPDRPPVATLTGLSSGAAAGSEGSFSWDGLVSDAPWIVGADPGVVLQGARLEVGFQPAAAPSAWQAHWAVVAGDEAGDPEDGGSGGAGPVLVRAPRMPGSWSLQLTAQFGEGRTATWYWRVRVAP